MKRGLSASELQDFAAANNSDENLESEVHGVNEDEKGVAWNLSSPLPESLKDWWARVHSARLFVDVEYGQWGLVIWPRDAIAQKNGEFWIADRDDLALGDVVIGEFLGDADLLMVRCDPESPNFGSVWIVFGIEPPEEWPKVGDSVDDFVHRFIEAEGRKFWERTAQPGGPLGTWDAFRDEG